MHGAIYSYAIFVSYLKESMFIDWRFDRFEHLTSDAFVHLFHMKSFHINVSINRNKPEIFLVVFFFICSFDYLFTFSIFLYGMCSIFGVDFAIPFSMRAWLIFICHPFLNGFGALKPKFSVLNQFHRRKDVRNLPCNAHCIKYRFKIALYTTRRLCVGMCMCEARFNANCMYWLWP